MAEPEQGPSAPDEEQPADAPADSPSPPADEKAPTEENDPDLAPAEDEDEPQAAATAWISVAGDAIFSGTPGGGTRRRRRQNRLDEADIAAVCRSFVEPPGIQDIVSELRINRLVVLAGDEGTGRRWAGVWLLNQVCSGDLRMIAPDASLDQLGTTEFRANQGYLVADYVGDQGPSARHRFDVDVLRARLLDRRAHLVITTSPQIGRHHFPGTHQPWTPLRGDALAAEVIGRYTELVGPDDRGRLLEACRNLSLSSTRSVLDTLLDSGLDGALSHARKLDEGRVAGWFNDRPGEASVVRVTVAAFVPFCPKRTYETHQTRLRQLRRLRWSDTDAPPEPLLQEHHELRKIDLLETSAVPFATEGARPRVRPVAELHTAIVTEILDRFGDDLLHPLQQLQHEAALSGDVVTQLGVARGVSLLARVAPDDARAMLHEWSNGLAAQRRTAAYALSWMCDDEATAEVALALATSWCSGAGSRRAVTAALAFGLELSVRFPARSVSHLWHLALRSDVIRSYAVQALAALVRTTASDHDQIDQVLRTVALQMRHLLDRRPVRYQRVRKGTSVIRDLLKANAPDGEGTVTVHLLRTHPVLAERLGRLWAEVLCSRPDRHPAVLALREDLSRLEPGTDDDTVAALGSAIRSRMAPEQWEWLRRDLPGGDWHW